jgi:hypothetical protein
VTAEQLGFKFTNVPHLMRVRCHFCSRQKREWEVHQLGDAARSTQVICADCLEWHQTALEFLAGRAKPGCQCCMATWDFLRDRSPGVEIRFYVVPRDGILQLLCDSCIGPYTAKRADLYRGTAFGTTVLKI